jgi:glutamate synthase (NADPH) small chain
MAEKMLQFTHVQRSMPAKRAPEARAHDFDEIYSEFSLEAACRSASRVAHSRTIFPTG